MFGAAFNLLLREHVVQRLGVVFGTDLALPVCLAVLLVIWVLAEVGVKTVSIDFAGSDELVDQFLVCWFEGSVEYTFWLVRESDPAVGDDIDIGMLAESWKIEEALRAVEMDMPRYDKRVVLNTAVFVGHFIKSDTVVSRLIISLLIIPAGWAFSEATLQTSFSLLATCRIGRAALNVQG